MLINSLKNNRGNAEIHGALLVVAMVVVVGGLLLWWRDFSDLAFFKNQGGEAVKKLEQDIADWQANLSNLNLSNVNSADIQKQIDQAVGGLINNSNTNSSESEPVAWTEYINGKWGFTIKIPQRVFLSVKSCGDEKGVLETATFENGDNFYISTKKYLLDNNGQCEQGDTTVDFLKDVKKDYFTQWKIQLKTINNDEELTRYVQELYGSGCQVAEKRGSYLSNGYDIIIAGDGKSVDETKCSLAFPNSYVMKYYPARGEVAYWDLGIDQRFKAVDNKYYDQEMINSFMFKPE